MQKSPAMNPDEHISRFVETMEILVPVAEARKRIPDQSVKAELVNVERRIQRTIMLVYTANAKAAPIQECSGVEACEVHRPHST